MKAINELLSSKKFWAAVVGLVIVITNQFGLNLNETELLSVVYTIIGYIVGQGIADNGKAAKQ